MIDKMSQRMPMVGSKVRTLLKTALWQLTVVALWTELGLRLVLGIQSVSDLVR